MNIVCHQICTGCEVGALKAQLTDDRNQSRVSSIEDLKSQVDAGIASATAMSRENPNVPEDIIAAQLAALSSVLGGVLGKHEFELPQQRVVCAQDGPKGLLRRCGATAVSV